MAFIGRAVAPAPISTNDVPDLPASKITSGTFATGRISEASVTQHASDFDDNSIKTNIALLGFKTAVNGSLAKYSLQDTVIDEFADSTGVNASSSTNETIGSGRVTGGTFAGTQTLIADGTGTPIGDHTGGAGLASAFDGTDHASALSSSAVGLASGVTSNGYSIIGKYWGSGVTKSINKFEYHSSSNDGFNTSGGNASGMTLQLYGGNDSNFSNAVALGSAVAIPNGRSNSDSVVSTSTGSGLYSYHWVKHTAPNGDNNCSELNFWEDSLTINNLTLVSNSTTASSVPSKSDLIILMKDSTGTATINTDIKAFISRDNGSNFTEVTLVDEGSYGTNTKILVAHDVDISSQPSGTSMVYKITTLNQSGSKITDINAVSLGWK